MINIKVKINKNSVESLAQHRVYLQDSGRNHAYINAFKKGIKPGDVVVDLGSGSGILSFLAIKAGCKKVYAVERSGYMIEVARAIAKRNDFESKIEFINADIGDVVLPEPVDAIIHEQIGDFLWDEFMVPKVARIRDAFLKKDGKIFPAHFELFAMAGRLPQFDYDEKFWQSNELQIDLWDFKEYDLKQLQAKKSVHRIHNHEECELLSPPVLVTKTDLYADSTIAPLVELKLEPTKSGVVNCILFYFDAKFDGENLISSQPFSPNAHWTPFAIPIYPNLKIEKGQTLDLQVRPSDDAHKWDLRYSY